MIFEGLIWIAAGEENRGKGTLERGLSVLSSARVDFAVAMASALRRCVEAGVPPNSGEVDSVSNIDRTVTSNMLHAVLLGTFSSLDVISLESEMEKADIMGVKDLFNLYSRVKHDVRAALQQSASGDTEGLTQESISPGETARERERQTNAQPKVEMLGGAPSRPETRRSEVERFCGCCFKVMFGEYYKCPSCEKLVCPQCWNKSNRLCRDCGKGQAENSNDSDSEEMAQAPNPAALTACSFALGQASAEIPQETNQGISVPLGDTMQDDLRIANRDQALDLINELREKNNATTAAELQKALRNKDPFIRELAAKCYGELERSECEPIFMDLLEDPDYRVAESAADAIVRTDWEFQLDRLLQYAKSSRWGTRKATIRILGSRPHEKAYATVIAAIDDEHEAVRAEAVQGLKWSNDSRTVQAYQTAARDSSRLVKVYTLRALQTPVNIDEKSALEIIKNALDDPDVRHHALDAAIYWGSNDAISLLKAECVRGGPFPSIMRYAKNSKNKHNIISAVHDMEIDDRRKIDLLWEIGDESSLESIEVLADSSFGEPWKGRIEAARVLKHKLHKSGLIDALDNKNSFVRQFAAERLEEFPCREVANGLESRINDPDDYVRLKIVSALGSMGGYISKAPFIKALSDRDDSVRQVALCSIHRTTTTFMEEDVAAASSFLSAEKEYTRHYACFVLGTSGRTSALRPLRRMLGDNSPIVRLEAARALGEIRLVEAIPALELASNDVDSEVRSAAVEERQYIQEAWELTERSGT